MTTKAFYYFVALLLSWCIARLLHSARVRQWLWLTLSYALYAMWTPWFLAVLFVSSIANFALANYLRGKPSPARLWTGITFNLLLLVSFKYVPPVAAQLGKFGPASMLATLALPIGISFWTFQALSYLIDVYREDEVAPTLLEFCLFMSFWPIVLSGPICRLGRLLPQFRQAASLTSARAVAALDRIMAGLLMMGLGQVLANGMRYGQGIDAAFDSPRMHWGGLDVWFLAIGYGFELFFNFAGYSHLVIGAASLFGFQLPENFAAPYFSQSPSEFWTRWHISLSQWIRDYLFMPLATARREKWWRNLALVISMVVFGIWHKGTWLFLIWGAYQGVLLVLHRRWQEMVGGFNFARAPLLNPASWLVTFCLMMLGWLFFRATDLGQALAMWHAIFSPRSYSHFELPSSLYELIAVLAVSYFVAVLISRFVTRRVPVFGRFWIARAGIYAVMLYVGLLHAAEPQAFIYFQF